MSLICNFCRWGDHDQCQGGATKLCVCPECWTDEDDPDEDG